MYCNFNLYCIEKLNSQTFAVPLKQPISLFIDLREHYFITGWKKNPNVYIFMIPTVLRIWIRHIRMFLGLLDMYPDPAMAPSIIK